MFYKAIVNQLILFQFCINFCKLLWLHSCIRSAFIFGWLVFSPDYFMCHYTSTHVLALDFFIIKTTTSASQWRYRVNSNSKQTCISKPSSLLRFFPALDQGPGAGSSLLSRYRHTLKPDFPFSGQYFTTWHNKFKLFMYQIGVCISYSYILVFGTLVYSELFFFFLNSTLFKFVAYHVWFRASATFTCTKCIA